MECPCRCRTWKVVPAFLGAEVFSFFVFFLNGCCTFVFCFFVGETHPIWRKRSRETSYFEAASLTGLLDPSGLGAGEVVGMAVPWCQGSSLLIDSQFLRCPVALSKAYRAYLLNPHFETCKVSFPGQLCEASRRWRKPNSCALLPPNADLQDHQHHQSGNRNFGGAQSGAPCGVSDWRRFGLSKKKNQQCTGYMCWKIAHQPKKSRKQKVDLYSVSRNLTSISKNFLSWNPETKAYSMDH